MTHFSPISSVQGHAKYKQAKESIYQQILQSGARPGDKIGTEAVFIKALGISVTTVRRALDELVREGILVRRVGKGTFLESLSKRETDLSSSVLLLGHNSWHFLREDVFFGSIVNAFSERARECGLRQVVMINEWGESPETELEDIRRHRPSAIVYPFVDTRRSSFLNSVSALNIPLMVYGHPVEGLNASQVYFDEYEGGVQMATHLLGRGYRDISIIAPPLESPAGQLRRKGFVETIRAVRSARLVAEVTVRGYGEQAGYEAVTDLVTGSKPRAIFCAGDLLAYGAIKRVEELGMSVPDEIAIAGYGDFKVSTFYHPQLTTIELGLQQMGRIISDWALAAINQGQTGDQTPMNQKLPVKLIVRDTA